MITPRPFLRLGSLAALLSVPATVHAQTDQAWNPAGPDDNWNKTSLNWDGAGIWIDNNNAVFDGAADTINVTVPIIFNNLTFNSTGYTMASAGAGNFTLGDDLGSTITVTDAAHTATINETLANSLLGASTLTKAGNGTLVLLGTANNTYSGGTVISAGTLTASHEGALGTGTVTNNATLNLNKAAVTFTGLSNALSGNGTTNVTALGTGSGTVLLNGNYSNYTGTWNIGVGATSGAGKVQFNGPDNAAATINVLTHGAVFSSSGIHNAAIVLNGGDTGESFGQLRVETNAVWAGPVTLAGNISGAGDSIIGTNSGNGTFSGLIGESGGPRLLSKGGNGTSILTNANTYSGGTSILSGAVSVSSINNTGNTGNLGTGSVISLGNGSTGATLSYTGSGENHNRVINLAGTIGGATLTQSGPSGNLKFTGDLTASGVGGKTLTLNGNTAGSGEISGAIGNIFDNGSNLSTSATAAFVSGATSLAVNSVAGLVIGSTVSGTGIAAGTRVTAISGTTVTLSTATNAAGQALTFTAANALFKNGSGTWTLSGNNSFTGNVLVNAGALKITNSNALGAGNKTVTIFPTTNPSSNSSLQLDGSGGNITLGSNLSFTTSYDALQVGTQLPISGAAAIINLAGDNTIAGNFTFTAGGGGTAFLVNGGTLTLSGNIATNGGTRPAFLRGDGNGFITGNISNGTGTTPVGAVTKDTGTGTWTLSGTNTYTGNTTVNTGTLKLDYRNNNTSKLADTGGALILGGGTLELSGGSHEEIVTSTTLTGPTSTITRTPGTPDISGTSTLRLNTVTPGTGSVSFTAGGLASTDNTNANGILPWARFGNAWGTNSTNAADGPITAYSAFTDVTRLGPVSITDAITSNVRIINGGTSGNITLGAATTRINSLLMDASDGAAIIDTTGGTLMLGDETGGTLWQTSTSGGLTIGTAPNSGTLTSGNTANATAAPITLQNDSTANPLVINASITNNGTDPVSLFKGGAGEVRIAGNNTFTGAVNAGAGTLHLSGNNTFTGALNIANPGTTVILSGNNSARPAGANNLTVISPGTTLQLQANAGNTTAGFSSALSTERTALAPLLLNNGGTLQLRGDSTVTFTGGNAMGGWNNAVQNIDVNQLTAAGSNQLLTIAPGTIPYANSVTLNVTGGNGYSLRLGTLQNVLATTNATSNVNLNPTSARLEIEGFSTNVASTNSVGALNLGGTALGNAVTGVIANQATGSAGTGAVTVTKNGTSTWDLQGLNTYTGTTTVNTGTLKLSGNRTAAAGAITVGNPASASALLEVSNGTFATGTFTVGNGNNTTAGTVNQTGGTLTMSGNQLLLGNNGTTFTSGSNSTGTYNLSGGTLNTIAGSLGVVIGVNHGTTGVFNLSGTGALLMPATSTLQITRSDNSAAGYATGTFNQTAGTATVGILQMGGSSTGSGLANAGNNATLNLSGGTFSAVTFNQLSGANDSTSAINISGTADVTLPAFPTVRGINATAALTLNGGLLRPAAASTAWLGGLTSANIKAGGANLEVPTGRDITISQNLLTDSVSTGGGLTKTGTGTLTLTGANTWTGTTTVSAGKLLVNNASGSGTGSGSLTIASTATLGGSGTLGAGGTLTIQGTLAPGNSPGILTSDKPVNFDLGSTFLVEANSATAGTGYDVLNANSSLSIATSSVFQLTLGYAPAPGDAFTFINLASGSISGFFSNLQDGGTYTANFSGTDYDFTASYAGGSGNDLVVTAVPEPTTPLLLGLLTGFATLFRRRRAA